ncbi:ABC transporter permease [Natronorubrum texcoconense]|uniref:Putative ABC transport system permease protein n=1 Tax=Natronorubrum texcoconense TaxID=1095776 RepID=A0A1G9GAE5_9EURY|nr:ABC transporter permease [Natronorubrum texcoconense]SDK97678.1 putative ABC transport system permease protein [Natronorubrum texcoconense]
MRPTESLRLAWRSIRGHKLRSALTTLGIVIGIAAVIAFVTLGASLQAGIIGDISPDDQRNSYGWAADPDTEGGPLAGAQPVFSQDDLDALNDDEDIDAAYGYMPLSTQALVYEGEISPQSDALVAAGPPYIRENTLEEGRQFEQGEREAVVNPAVAGQFEEDLEVGDELTIALQGGQQTTVTVVGITESSEGLSPFEGFEPSPRVYVPTDPFYTEDAAGAIPGGGGGGDGDGTDENGEANDGGEADENDEGGDGTDENETDTDAPDGPGDALFLAIVVEAESADESDIDRAKESALAYLESDESDASELLGDDLEITLQTSAELLQQLEDVLDLLQNFIVGIAAISLLVGSIGIANIMLVSVTERTREIGIMKAVGAQNREILGLFLAESVILGIVGAILGTLLGLIAGYLGAWYIDLPLVYPYEYVVLAIAVGVLVGIAAGLYPAWRAARTDPIDALRYE